MDLNHVYEILGKNVTYGRLAPDGEELVSRGVILGIFLNEDQRPQVRILDGGKQLNIDVVAIGKTHEELAGYFDYVRQVRARADEINVEIKAMGHKGNQELEDKLHIVHAGPKVTIEPNPEALDEGETTH